MDLPVYPLSFNTGEEVDAVLLKALASYTREEVNQAIAATIQSLPNL